MTDKKDVDWEHLKKKIQQVVDKEDSGKKNKHGSAGDWEHTKKRIEKEIKERKKTQTKKESKEKENKETTQSQSKQKQEKKDLFQPLHFHEIDKKLHELSGYFEKDAHLQEIKTYTPEKSAKPLKKKDKKEAKPTHHFDHSITKDTYEHVTSHIDAVSKKSKKSSVSLQETLHDQSWEKTKALIEQALEQQRKRTKDLSYDELRKQSAKAKKHIRKDLKKSKSKISKDADKKSVRTEGWDVIGKTKRKIKIKKRKKLDTSPSEQSPTEPELPSEKKDESHSSQLSYLPVRKKSQEPLPIHQQLRIRQEKKRKQQARQSLIKKLKPFRITINRPTLSTAPIKHFITGNLVELVLTSIGLYFLTTMQPGNMRIGFTLLLIASFMMFLMVEGIKSTDYSVDSRFLSYLAQSPRKQASLFYIKEKKYNPDVKTSSYLYKRIINVIPSIKNIYEKIHNYKFKKNSFSLSDRIAIVLIAWTLFLFVITSDLEIFFILIFIGILITKELTDIYTTPSFKTRLNAYIIFFLVTYIILIYQKVLQILQS